jgi:hypothetical protein
MDLELDRRCSRTLYPLREARRFILKHLPTAPSALEGATFEIRAEIRAESRGVRWKTICRWKTGESAGMALDRAVADWSSLSKETKRMKLR